MSDSGTPPPSDGGSASNDGGAMSADAGTPPPVDGTLGDPSACGSTRSRCSDREICVGGACVCRLGLTRAAGSCVDLTSDPRNCGAAGNDCGDRSCVEGMCVDRCPDFATRCDGACVNWRSDPLNCGECGARCARDEACVSGRCRPYAPATGCTMCPCDATCHGDLNQCCALGPMDSLVLCISGETCPTRL
jgi:hypothetical protein